MIWRPFMRRMGESAKRVRLLGLVFDNGWQEPEPLNGFAPHSHGRVRMSRSKVKSQGQQGQKRAVHSHPRSMDEMERPRCR